MSKALLNTPYASLYEAEEASALLDLINTMYVATTRAEDCLFIWTKNMDNDKNSSQITCAQLLHDFREIHSVNDEKFPESKASFFGPEVDTNITTKIITKSCHWQDILSLEHGSSIIKDAARQGIDIHATLATKVVTKLSPDALALRKAVETHPRLAQYYRPGLRVMTERDILINSHERIRPDRVVLYDDEALIIDYKTGQVHGSHIKQMDAYASVIYSMGYKKVRSLLVYIDPLNLDIHITEQNHDIKY